MNESAAFGDKHMTTVEVAEALGVSDETIRRIGKELFPENVVNGRPSYWTESQATEIKSRIGTGRNDLHNIVEVKNTITDLEAAQMLLKSAEHFKARFDEERIKRIKAENQLAQVKPKVEFFDQVADSGDALQMRDVAAALNLRGWGRNNIFDFLRRQGVLDDRNIPYREYQDRGYFRVIEQKFTDREGETHINLKTLVYQRGVDFIRKLIGEAACTTFWAVCPFWAFPSGRF
jgi:phage antirepressor YoqD-like protein